ncbi:nuclear body protein SP140-like [Peromyscus maniculatus bairdii]|uniref:nuclear body protein SP140-like n=1 Tax=Peromyscus maniculatus bairdii TaxID=230844 RepID=UPI003FD116C1
MFKHFHENKVEIASAITKPFPFLMSLQDRGFISEQKFQTNARLHSIFLRPQKKCKTLDAAGKVVYDILSDLQKKFSLPLLQVIFSTTHLKAYPDLKETMRSFLDDTVETGNNTIVGKSKGKRSKVTNESLCAFDVSNKLFTARIIIVIVCDNGVDCGDLPLALGTCCLYDKDILCT